MTGAGVLGLITGSFLNVVVWRVPRSEAVVRPPSHCPVCQHLIAPRDNVPVLGWLLLRGRCRHCAASISWRYPAVELATAALFVAMVMRFGLHPVLPAYLYLAAVGLALSLIDLDVRRLPNALTLPSYVVGIGLLGLASLARPGSGSFVRALIGMAVLYGFYLLLVFIKPGAMGWGDVKLAGVLGLYLGFLGWGTLVVGAFAAFLLGGVAGITLIVTSRAGRKARIPFGPFMIAGALLAVFAGHDIAHWYLHSTIG